MRDAINELIIYVIKCVTLLGNISEENLSFSVLLQENRQYIRCVLIISIMHFDLLAVTCFSAVPVSVCDATQQGMGSGLVRHYFKVGLWEQLYLLFLRWWVLLIVMFFI